MESEQHGLEETWDLINLLVTFPSKEHFSVHNFVLTQLNISGVFLRWFEKQELISWTLPTAQLTIPEICHFWKRLPYLKMNFNATKEESHLVWV